MAKSRTKKAFVTLFKLAISALAIWYLVGSLSQPEKDQIVSSLKKAHFSWLILAFLFFNISKVISALRLNKFFACFQLQMKESVNLMLYYIGMFYNLFLPGGIGGDGYKVFYLHKKHKASTKMLVAATLLDRISGAVVLGLLALVVFVMSSANNIFLGQDFVAIGLALLTIPIFYVVHKMLFPTFQPEFFRGIVYGFGVQVSQLISAIFILLSLGISTAFFDYFTLFLISSIAAVLPFTIGGVGARELVMLEGVAFFDSISGNAAEAMAFSILFFVITALSSFVGMFFTFKLK